MFVLGDLVVIAGNCDIPYFKGSTAVVVRNMGHNISDTSLDKSYQLQFADGSRHVFTQRELILLSRAERKSNENW
jgi:hypothetical protein